MTATSGLRLAGTRESRIAVRRPILLLLAFFGLVFAGPYFAPHEVSLKPTVSPINKRAPSLEHPMGTNSTDRDVLGLVLRGARLSLGIGVASMLIAVAVGTTYGAAAAMSGGWVDGLLMRTTDVTLAVPRFLILLAVTSIVSEPPSSRQLILLIGLTGWFDIARITRGEVGSLLQRDWVLASRATGVGSWRMARRHIFPHLVPMLLVVATLGIARTIVLEAALAFLGAGGRSESLGSLLHSGSALWSTTWWLSVFPGLAIVLLVLACNALGDALRDVFAPEQVHAWPTT